MQRKKQTGGRLKMSTVPDRLSKLRELMVRDGIDYYIVPTADFHQSEYVGEHFTARKYITGFSGSAGTAMIDAKEARLWTDGRYFIQAADQLEGTTVELMKMGQPGVPTLTEHLKQVVKPGEVIGFDGRVVSMGEGQGYEAVADAKEARIVYTCDLIDEIWTDRPPLSEEPAFALELQYAGETTAEKLTRIREAMKENQATVHVVTTLDDICWTLNMRGNDIEYFPLVLSYAIVTMDEYHLYIQESKLSEEMKAAFAKDKVVLHPYNDIYEDVKKYGAGETLLVDAKNLNYALYNNLSKDAKRVEKANPEIRFKAIKNATEIENIRQAQIKDSVAHVRFMKWLKENIGKEEITELSAAAKMDSFREEMGNFISPSFEPICSFGAHAAIVHYAPSPETDIPLGTDGFFLTDTGAGFKEGSTDITRTYALGNITRQMKEDFTLVAISNLSLANAVFMKGCNGVNLDSYTRKPFWDRRLNFNHGTGHGVGYLLNIHEGPAGIRWRYVAGDTEPFEAGMVITDEPGRYIEGAYGIRLENELLVCEDELNEFGQFMRFDVITYVPFDLDAIVPEFMTEEERKLLNTYHQSVFEKVSPHLNEEEKEWLARYTRAV